MLSRSARFWLVGLGGEVGFQKFESFVVALALEKVGELRVDGFWQRVFESLDLF